MKNGINRRDFVKGIGGALAVTNFLHPSKLFAQTPRAPMKLLFVGLSHGWGHTSSTPQITYNGDPTNWSFINGLSPLNAIKNDCSFIDGVRGTTWGNAHDVSYSDWLTHAVPFNEGTSAQLGAYPEPMGPSLDWYLAKQFNTKVLRAGIYQGNALCFDDKFQRQAIYNSAQSAYDDLISTFLALKGGGNGQTQKDKLTRKELFALAKTQLSGLNSVSPKASKGMMGSYLSSLQNLETSAISSLTSGNTLANETILSRPGYAEAPGIEISNILEMVRLAFLGGSHQFAVVNIGDAVGGTPFPWVDGNGVNRIGDPTTSGFHQGCAHYTDTTSDPIYAFRGYVQYHARKIVEFVNKLRTTQDIDGRSLLDNTLIVLSGEISDGSHTTEHKGVTLLGGGAGKITQGKLHIPERLDVNNRMGYFLGGQLRNGNNIENNTWYGPRYITKHTEADLSVAIARMMGVNISKFGFNVDNWQPFVLT